MNTNNRFFLSAFITLCIMFYISIWIEDGQQAHSTRVVGIIIATVIAAVPIYSIDRWSLKRQTIVHAAVIVAVVLPCLLISNWYEWQTRLGLSLMLLTYISFGAAGWLVGFVINKITERK